MGTDEVKSENTGGKQDTRFKPGQSGNPAGRPLGAENFSTKWRKAIERIADMNESTPDEIEMQLLLVGYKKAKEGDYRFWGDVFDRIYGKSAQPVSHTFEPTDAHKAMADKAIETLLNSYEADTDTRHLTTER